MKILLPSIACLALLAGCASAPPQLISSAARIERVQFSAIEIQDYATPREVVGNNVYFTGWFPIADKFVTPAFHEAMTAKLRATLQADGAGAALQLTVLEAGFLMDSRAADSVAFVGLAAAFRPRPYKCTVTLNITARAKSERRSFEQIEVTNRSFPDLEQPAKFISGCQDKLAYQVAQHLNSLQ